MGRRGSCLMLILTALLAAVAVGVASASSRLPVFPIPGFAAPQLQVGGVSRLNDGGGLIAGSTTRAPASWQPVVVRLLVDGSVDLGYGSQGISSARIGPDGQPTSLAVNPNTGNAWIGIAGPRRHGAILALNGQGSRDQGFGHNGILGLGASRAPVALAWQPGQLLVASGTDPCAGCLLTVINPSTGAAIARGNLMPASASRSVGCVGGLITSVALINSSAALLAYRGGRQCGAELITVAIPVGHGHGPLRAITAAPLGATTASALVTAVGPDICLAASTPGATAFGPFLASRQTFTQSLAPGGRLVALVALGGGACAALITDGRHHRGLVVQESLQRRQATIDAVPPAVEALGMIRCHVHLLVIGALPSNHGRSGSVVVVPVRRGPSAQVAGRALAGGEPSRCR